MDSRSAPSERVGVASLPKVIIIDVGHGNAAIIWEQNQVTVIDGGRGGILLEVLDHFGISHVNTVIISHADEDHIGGIEPLFTRADIRVDVVILNSAESRGSDAFMALRRGLAKARKDRRTQTQVGLAVGTPLPVKHSDTEIEILSPLPENALGGEHGLDIDGRVQSANSGSAVLKVIQLGQPLVLFAADVDSRGLNYLLAENSDLTAKVLIFPHHGGLPAHDGPTEFARRLVEAVTPQIIVFSVGRNNAGFPRPEIVRGVREGAPGAHIVCTQLVRACAAVLPRNDTGHLSSVPAKGKELDACCGGSLTLSIHELLDQPQIEAHRKFILRNAPTALCTKHGAEGPEPPKGKASRVRPS